MEGRFTPRSFGVSCGTTSCSSPDLSWADFSYYAQLVFLATKFPSNVSINLQCGPTHYQEAPSEDHTDVQINLSIGYHLPFPPPFSLTADSPISLPSLTFERASILYNIAAIYASMAASEARAEAVGIKRALGFLTVVARCSGGRYLRFEGRQHVVDEMIEDARGCLQ
jgi:programmed cell death 6-interacting protein